LLTDVVFRSQGMKRFFEQIYQAILRHIDFDIVKCVIVGSPGFVREQVYDYIFAEAVVSTLSIGAFCSQGKIDHQVGY